MVDVSEKSVTKRLATASGIVVMLAETVKLIQNRELVKGDVLEVSRLAGIMAAKRTSDLIPLCHPLPISSVDVQFEWLDDHRLRIAATVTVTGRTGVEMEALTAVSVAALTVYDMCKAVDKGITITAILLDEKDGGRSGHYQRS